VRRMRRRAQEEGRQVDAPPLIALLTDFGTQDYYVGAMKGVILSINRRASIVDLSHEVHPQDVMTAYFLLQNSYKHFPAGTIFVAVVDPGVGSPRHILCVETECHLFLAPDNGTLGFLERDARRIFRVTNRRLMLGSISATFHGRDIFAPVAAHLSLGLDLERLGPRTRTMERLSARPIEASSEGHLLGQVVTIDRFGNLVTDIRGDRVDGASEVRVGRARIQGVSRTYADGKKGAALAYVGSAGTLEIAVAHGSAAKKLKIARGETVQVIRKS